MQEEDRECWKVRVKFQKQVKVTVTKEGQEEVTRNVSS
jgi:hypothetical protein